MELFYRLAMKGGGIFWVVGGMWWDILCDIFHGLVGLVGGMSWVDIFDGGWGCVEINFGWVGGAWTLFMGENEWVEVYSE